LMTDLASSFFRCSITLSLSVPEVELTWPKRDKLSAKQMKNSGMHFATSELNFNRRSIKAVDFR